MKLAARMTLLLATFMLFSVALAQEPAEEKKKGGGLPEQLTDSDQPIQIDADNMVVYRNENKIVFTGNVVLRQAPTVIRANKATAFYHEKNWEIKNAVCIGNVRIVRDKTFARCGKATYDNKKQLIIMEESPVIYQENHMFRGTILKYFMQDERITGTNVRYQRNPTPPAIAPKGP